jgi:hypothetical protein
VDQYLTVYCQNLADLYTYLMGLPLQDKLYVCPVRVIALRAFRRGHVMAKIISYWPFTVEVRV